MMKHVIKHSKKGRLWLLGLLMAGMCLSPAGFAKSKHHTPHESVNTSELQPIQAGEVVSGAVVLTRDFRNRTIRADISATDLARGEAYSIWWVVFNRPWFCEIPWECNSGDLGRDKVRASAFWAGGFLADAMGIANHTIGVGVGKTRREALVGEYIGLRNLYGSEIHVVLRSHGPAGVPGTVAKQIGTANEACLNGVCPNKFFSVHRAR